MTPGAGPTDQAAVLRQALLQIRELRAQLAEAAQNRAEPIAIIGMGCRLPGGADTPEAFWHLLSHGIDAVSEVPRQRWDAQAFYDADPDAPGKISTRAGAFLTDVDLFDAGFFGISPREAARMDPQQRLLLEVAWEALEHACLAPDRLAGTRTGVFVGLATHDYARLYLQAGDPTHVDAYFSTGNSPSVASGRLSYVLGLHGPSLTVDTACSSSLVAVHLACQSLRSGACEVALAGGVNLILSPEISINFSRARMLAKDGRCKTFDAAADGYGRGEGCGVVVCKRLRDAQAEGDRILAVIRGADVNHDGRSGGLTAPSGPAQEAVMRQALHEAGVDPGLIGYVEAHGTGTALGDPIEVRALTSVLQAGRAADRPLVLGSVKANIGHLEAAAGIAGLIKVILALQHREIPPHLHFQTLNPNITLNGCPIHIPREPLQWQPIDGRRLAGVSSFGFSGTNAHVVVEEAPAPSEAPAVRTEPPHLLCLSAKEPAALRALTQGYQAYLTDDALALGDVCYAASTGRAHFAHRLAVVAASVDEARDGLAACASSGRGTTGVVEGFHGAQMVFLFPGQGAQYVGMGRNLYRAYAPFREILERCDAALRDELEQPLLSVLFEGAGPLDDTAYTQPALFAFEVALAELWRSWGITPGAVLGHSLGEYAAACVAGVFSLEEGIRLVAARARLMQSLPTGGAMAAVFASEAQVAAALADRPELSIAALNGPDNTVVSGPAPVLQSWLAQLAAAGIEARLLPVSHAFHSALLEPILEAFERRAGQVPYGEARIPIASNLTGQVQRRFTAEYWRLQARRPVQFATALQNLVQQGGRVFVEVGPHPVLSGLGRHCVEPATWVASLQRGRDERRTILEALGRLYVLGAEVNWQQVYASGSYRKLALPTYPFQRQRYWLDRGAVQPPSAAPLAESGDHSPLLGRRLTSPAFEGTVFEHRLSADNVPLVHDSDGLVHVGVHLELLAAAAAGCLGTTRCEISNATFVQALVLDTPRTVQLLCKNSEVRVCSRAGDEAWTLHVMGELRPLPDPVARRSLDEARRRCSQEQSGEALCQALERHGFRLGPTVRWIERFWRGDGEAVCQMRPARVSETGQHFTLGIHPGLIEASAQLAYAALPSGDLGCYMLVAWDALKLYGGAEGALWGYARRLGAPNEQGVGVELCLTTADGRVVFAAQGCWFKRLATPHVARGTSATVPQSAVPRGSQAVPPLGTASQPWRVVVEERGRLDSITLRPTPRQTPGPGQVEIAVCAAGLNFRDVLDAHGLYPGEAGPLGADCAGVIAAIGEGVTSLRVGDAVLALAFGSLAQFVMTSAQHVLPLPPQMSFVEAATIPVPFLTAWFGLYVLGGLQAGERVLIHNAAGGVGMAALALAQRVGARIFATASPGKHAYLRSRGLEDVMNSRSLDFAAQVQARTAGAGVHVTLGALQDKTVAANLAALTPGGRYIELGKHDAWSPEQVAAMRPDIAYHRFDLAAVSRRDPERLHAVFRDVLAAFASGALQPLPHQVFPLEEVQTAFRTMARARHVGRIILASKSEQPASPVAPPQAPRGEADIRHKLQLAPEQARDRLSAHIHSLVARILEVQPPAQVPRSVPLSELGFDSMMAVEFANLLGRSLGRQLPPSLPYNHPTIAALTEHLLPLVLPSAVLAAREPPPDDGAMSGSGRTQPLEQRLASVVQSLNEPIAVIGMGCRFPGGANDPQSFWALLTAGVHAVSQMPPERCNGEVPPERRGGFLSHIEDFDAAFFGITDPEAVAMDPQQRLLLEVAWEALENAGQAGELLSGSETGVFVGMGSQSSDYAWLQFSNPEHIGLHTVAGNFHSLAAGRLSYFLDLKGPNMVVDAACASALVAVHLACQSLRGGECDMALAGAVNLILLPHVSIAVERAGLLSAQGACRTFDEAADGFVRSEGCGVVVLKRLSDALAAGDNVLAVMRGSAVSQDGRSNGLTAPNGLAQAAVIRKALRTAGVSPAEVSYVEAHGTGTRLGDIIEAQALGEVLGHNRSIPFWLSSVKTNLGHLEAAAGMAGLIKTILALRYRAIPAHLHLTTVHADMDLAHIGARIPTVLSPWEAPRRLAGVSAFGMNGTNTHVVLEEAATQAITAPIEGDQLLTLSACHETALHELARRYAQALTAQPSWPDFCYSANTGRRHFASRLAVVASSCHQAARILTGFVAGEQASGLYTRGPLDESAAGSSLDALARTYVNGGSIDWAALYPTPRQKIPLPTYPFQRRRFWIDTPPLATCVVSDPPSHHLLHQIDWRPGPLSDGDVPTGEWLIFSDHSLGPAVAARLEACGASATLLFPGRPAAAGNHHRGLDPSSPEAFQHLLETSAARNMLYLWGLAATPVTDTTVVSLQRDQALVCGGLLHLVRALAQRQQPARLWLVTRGVGAGEVAQAPLWGMGTVIGVEHPELSCRCVDLDPAGTDNVHTLLRELRAVDGESRVAYRGEARLVARLVRAALPQTLAPLRANGTYLITGGLGGLGLEVARRLVTRGARHLMLVSRSASVTEGVRTLREAGATVQVMSADVAREADVQRVLTAIKQTMPPLRGIVHAAGVMADGLLARQDWDAFAAALPAKMEGAWNLHRLTEGLELAFLVLCSSATVWFGLPGAGSYAAANAFLDVLARYRHTRGEAAISINWGAWEGLGMAGTADARRASHWAYSGIDAFPVAQGLAVFDRLLGYERAQVAVLANDWVRMAAPADCGTACFLEELTGRSRPASGPAPPQPHVAEHTTATGEKTLLQQVGETVARVCELPPASALDVHRPLSELGLDSLGAVELRNQLATLVGQALPVTLVFNYPSIAAITDFLSQLTSTPPVRDAAPDTDPVRQSQERSPLEKVAALEELSDQEAEALLHHRLASLERRRPL
jgi:acyl transferase domain-containing protein/acyl carrier protein